MGVDYYAHAILGVRLRRKQLYRTTIMRGCAHPAGLGQRYCPECGAAQRVERDEPIPGYDDAKQTIGGATVFFDREEDNGQALTYIYYISVSSGSSRGGGHAGMRIVDDWGNDKTQLQQLLQPLGLWDDKAYGLWAVLTANC